MPFDPNLPANNSPISSAELRAQFNALKALIDQLPTHADLQNLRNELLSNSAASVNDIDILPVMPSDPPTQSDVLQVVDKFNELLDGLKRE